MKRLKNIFRSIKVELGGHQIIAVAVAIGLILFFLIITYFSERIDENNIDRRTVYLNATIDGEKKCFAHNRCVYYSYEYKGVLYEDSTTVDEFKQCKGLSIAKGSTFSIMIDSLNPKSNRIDKKYRCK